MPAACPVRVVKRTTPKPKFLHQKNGLPVLGVKKTIFQSVGRNLCAEEELPVKLDPIRKHSKKVFDHDQAQLE